MDTHLATPIARSAQRASYVAFIGSGFGFASWASRIPAIRDELDASPSTLGLVLLAVAVGAVTALPLSGLLVNRFGTARTVAVSAVVVVLGMAVVAFGHTSGVPPVVVGLFLIGSGNGAWDVAMNVEGAAVEQRLGRALLPRLHAGFSVGTVAGALGGAAMVALGVPVAPHLLLAGVVCTAAVVPVTRAFLPLRIDPTPTGAGAPAGLNPLLAWTEPRTLLIGGFVLCMAFAEGTALDWLAVAVLDGYGAPDVAGPLVFATFLAAMTVVRWCGPPLLARHGRVRVLRVSATTALVGLALVVLGGSLALAFLGALLWGLGTALGFPVGMSAAADDPVHAAARVSVVSSIGYTAFLAGPPLIGLLGDQVGVLRSLATAGLLLAVAVLAAGTTRPVT